MADLQQFGAVIAVSREGSPRRESLIRASNITEIDITIPSQPKWTEDDVNDLRAEGDSRISRGSALAWLGHLNALRWFLDSDLETILILEDDVDWDIHLRTLQIPAAAAAIRRLVQNQSDPPGHLQHREDLNNFWGNVSTWDILYLGHCGDIFRSSQWTLSVPRIVYDDATLPRLRDLHPFTMKFLAAIGIGEYTRMIHQSIFPLCTFGFALTRNAAHRLLTEIASKEAEGGTMAYDVRVLEACRDLGFRCWTANPELFHHMDMQSEIEEINIPVAEDRPWMKEGADETGRLKPTKTGKAPNIACGARSNQYFSKEELSLEYLREAVGRQGICLKDPDEVDIAEEPYRPYDGPGDPRMWDGGSL